MENIHTAGYGERQPISFAGLKDRCWKHNKFGKKHAEKPIYCERPKDNNYRRTLNIANTRHGPMTAARSSSSDEDSTSTFPIATKLDGERIHQEMRQVSDFTANAGRSEPMSPCSSKIHIPPRLLMELQDPTT